MLGATRRGARLRRRLAVLAVLLCVRASSAGEEASSSPHRRALGREATAGSGTSSKLGAQAVKLAPIFSNIATAVAGTASLSTLAAAFKAAGFAAELKRAGTLFAPSDAAFAAALARLGLKKEALLASKALLTQVLQNHIVSQPLPAASLKSGASATSVLGGVIQFGAGKGGARSLHTKTSLAFFGRAALVTEADIRAGGSYLHVIDQVLLPASVLAQLMPRPSPRARPPPPFPSPMRRTPRSGSGRIGGGWSGAGYPAPPPDAPPPAEEPPLAPNPPPPTPSPPPPKIVELTLSSAEAGAPPRQAYSSAGAAFYPQGAIDGEVSSCYNGCREDCARSIPPAASPWWAVDLGARSAVTSLRILYSDSDCCLDSTDIEIWAGDALPNGSHGIANGTLCMAQPGWQKGPILTESVSGVGFALGGQRFRVVSYTCQPGSAGQFAIVLSRGAAAHLSFCSVSVFGYALPSPGLTP